MTTSAEPDRFDQSREVFRGYYLVTVRRGGTDEGRRFFARGLIAHGFGRLYLTPRGLHFLRYLTRRPVFLPVADLRGFDVVVSSRRRIRGRLALEVDWERDGQGLRSIFVLSGGVSATRRLADWLGAHVTPANDKSV